MRFGLEILQKKLDQEEKIMNKLISINITTYNRFLLLSRCLDSILKQTYKNIEINIVDDCSNDNTKEIIMKYTKEDSRIRYFRHEKNLGNAYARNTALKNTNGIYVAFMDDDDVWIDTEKLEKQYTLFENSSNNLGIICSNPRIYTAEDTYFDKIIKKPKDLKEAILKGNSLIYNSTCFTKKEIMDQVGGFDENIPKGIDSDFFRTCIVKYDYDVAFMDEVNTAVYEYGEDRMTPLTSIKAMKKNIKSNELCLYKFKDEFKNYPYVARLRKKNIFKQYIKLIFKEKNIKYIVNIIDILIKIR